MKRLVSAALALSLLGASATAAAADPYDHGGQGYGAGYNNQGYNGTYGNQDYRDYHRRSGNSDGGAVVAGVGLLALAAILASQHHHRFHRGWYGHDDGRYGWNYGYNRGYGDNYGERYHDGYRGYGDNDRHW